jgi:tetratricopeptide (TPR) repeat protein
LERQSSDDRFVDRGTNTLERIAERLDKEGKVFVAGLTGMGKTELVKQFVWRMCEAEKYKRIIWLTADSEALPSQIQKLANEFELQTSSETGLEDLWRAMVNRMDVGEKWLVIFDNLEDFQSLRLEKFGGIDMIATLRQSPTAASHGDVELLNRLNEDQAIRLFRTECKHRFSGPSSKFSDQELSTLVQTIGTHPATLCQVLSYMQITGVGVGEFLRAYKKSRVHFWDWRTPEFPSLVSQMSVVFREIKETPDSLRLLCVLCFLHSDSIPAWLLRSNPWLPDDPLKKILLSDWKLTEALRPLLTWSLIARTKTGFSIQKIVQESMRILMMRTDSGILERLDEKERSIKYWIGRCSELLYPMQGHFVWSTFSDQIEITKHAESCLECCIIYDIDLPINQTLLEAFTAYVILNTGQKYNPKLWTKAVQQYNSVQEPMGVKEGLLCHFISLRSFILKKYDDAFTASQMSMQTASHLMEQNGKWSLQYIYQHGCILLAQGKHDAAAVNFQKVIDFYQKNTFQQVAPLIELGRCLHDKGIESLEEANKLAIEELGSTAPETAVPLIVMGSMYVRVDRDKGLSKCTEALNRFKSAFGENHPREVVLVEHIARVFQDLGEHDLVLEWLQRVEPACEKLYRMNSILCANVLEQMAVSLCCKEKYDDAWQRFEKILRLIQIFENSTETTMSANLEISQRVGSLSETLFSLKRYNEPKSLRQCVISQLRKPPIAFGQSTDRARHQVKLANIYEYEGDLNSAHRELTEAVELLQLGLGDADQDVIKARHEHDKITRILERHREVQNPEEKLRSPIRETQPDVKGLRLRIPGFKKPQGKFHSGCPKTQRLIVPEDQGDATSRSESGSEGNESDSEGNESDSDGRTSLNNLYRGTQIPDETHSQETPQESSDGFQSVLIIGLAICLVLFLLYKL